ncbi:sigma-70 family RNA polymerase sigma factor [Pseudomonas typographi]|uniref:Sigma-70 family RNA polymerase sigma factor n=1 Tax=Pseudomonas typographi TaxID=2715964 RepID=A0ABR7Z2B2_9PSED|nr:sigma-70 family RNA polymerase sigma factor [Pseudomonas typographi]MBD1553540.1 sigma-70 family RNA polymerase sigma factor [Pseudomonas typographi]MBD1599630.1 sigma-70 family RNA polymerase sigma factor [Pseudomonas typographi]
MSKSLESQWSVLLARGNAGDQQAYRAFLQAVTPYLRGLARRRCSQVGVPADAEDVVQEILLAVHLKRATWDSKRPVGPWISTIARNKFIDSMRRRGRHIDVPLEEVIDTLPAEYPHEGEDSYTVEALLERLSRPQRDIVQLISLEGSTVRDTAQQLGMSEGAVRVALHRALKSLAALYRSALG